MVTGYKNGQRYKTAFTTFRKCSCLLINYIATLSKNSIGRLNIKNPGEQYYLLQEGGVSYIFGSEILNGIYIFGCDFSSPKFIFLDHKSREDIIFLGMRELTD